jgi:hypothetical protein
MARTVGADKMSEALADSVRPRMKGDTHALDSFKSILLDGLKEGGAVNNMKLSFFNAGNNLSVSVNDIKKGEVKSKALCEAFLNVYFDKNAVSPSKPLEHHTNT